MIRLAESRDIPALGKLLFQVHALHAESRPDLFTPGARKYSDSQLKELLLNPLRPVFVWEDENQIVSGYVFCEIEETASGNGRVGRKTIYIDDLCVDAASRNQGIGEKLYTFAKEYARKIGCQAITLNVWGFNRNAKAFYEHLGLRELKTVMEDIL